ncbi:unnamed protein product [Owenia fusiformis]|uniref:RNA helicase n=1 Tax=Owenia fusiformis TaxID=6347 RepID=A0A8S4Q6S6_OWEFU|nr:unnamed protein product [Owenia fusiformis]
MARQRKRFNQKARQKTDVKVDHSEDKKLQSLVDGHSREGYDESNLLVLPSRKRKTKTLAQDQHVPQKLSKKQRKNLQRIIDKKAKKSKRVEILESLQKVQANPKELSMLISTSEVTSQRFKATLDIEQSSTGQIKVNSISGSNKKKRKLEEDIEIKDSSESSTDTSDYSSDDDVDDETTKGNIDAVQNPDDAKNNDNKSDRTEDIECKSSANKTPLPSVSPTKTKVNNSNEHSAIGEKHDKTTGKVTEAAKEKAPVRSVINVPVNRTSEIQESRLKLPILGEEQHVMETISEHPVVILCGATGSGKTTQVPQFLYEAGYAHDVGMIGITEPRRVAAISMSKRVGTELNLSTREVSYQIRYEGNTTPDTKLKFMTDGVLLKEVQKDFLLSKYSVIIIDEAHERSIYTDILIGLLSRIVPLRHKKGSPLKLVIMSATLRVEDFTENSRLFKIKPPVIEIESRQFPVTMHFNKHTPQENAYLNEAYRKVCKIHRSLPEGGILVFVTGQQEVNTLCRKIRETFKSKLSDTKNKAVKEDDKESSQMKTKIPRVQLDDYSVLPEDDELSEQDGAHGNNQSDEELSEPDDDDTFDDVSREPGDSQNPIYVLPLYSMLPTHKQAKVFEAPPAGHRLVVVATNVAETSLTIPNIKYVVDTGKVKTKFYDKVTGVSSFKITWTSKASANQRAGRAGRTGPGHCYRLYSSAVFNDEFELFSSPEITRRPVDDLLLLMKDLNIDKVVNFPFPSPPDRLALKAAEKLLLSLGALEPPAKPQKPTRKSQRAEMDNPSARISPLGRAMACFPVAPRYGKMLSLGHQHNLLPYVIALVAALSVQELFVEIGEPPIDETEKQAWKNRVGKMVMLKKTWAGQGQSALLGDLMVLLKAVGACEYAGCSTDFCFQHGIRHKAMIEIRKLRSQLTNAVNSVLPAANVIMDPKMAPPSELQAKLLRQIILTGLSDHIARKLQEPSTGTNEEKKKLKMAYQSIHLEEPVYIHPNSVLYKQNHEYVVFQDITETSKLYMRGVSVIEAEWLPVFVPHGCTFSKPLDSPPPRYDSSSGNVLAHMTSTFGVRCWEIPAVELEYPECIDRVKYFARFLLEGLVCPKLKPFREDLLSAPATMNKSWTKLQPRTESLLKELLTEQVDCKTKLLKIWESQPTYLLSAYMQWIPQSRHLELEAMWPPL